jgi:arylsulfatase A-like enzyme
VPTLLTGPGFTGGGQVREMVSLVDLPPTLLDAAGLPVPACMQGHSLLPLLHGQRADWPAEAFIQISEAQVGRAVRTQRWKYGVNAPDRSGREHPNAARYVEEFLYDLQADPYELTNLIGLASHQATAAVLRERLIRRMVAAGEAAPVIEPAPSRPSGQRRVSAVEAQS